MAATLAALSSSSNQVECVIYNYISFAFVIIIIIIVHLLLYTRIILLSYTLYSQRCSEEKITKQLMYIRNKRLQKKK